LSSKQSTAEERAEALWKRMKPKVLEAVAKHSPERTDLKFDEIESNSASVGDLVARMLMQEALKEQAATTQTDIERARESLSDEARAVGKTPEQLRLTRIPDKPCELGTVRGPVPHLREYLYFPELQRGLFPPR
jgi:Trk K+ transport system NAD-binding subunit